MEESKIKSITFIIDDIRESVTDTWEELVDGNQEAAVKRVDEAIEKLRALKNNLTNKEE